MTTKQNANDLAKTARSEAAAIANGTKRTITQIITNWNECVKQAGFMCIYNFPTTGYSRKSQIADDLIRCAGQLDDYCEPNPHAPQTVEQQTREINAALTRVLDADEAHSEALEMNAELKAGVIPVIIDTRPIGESSRQLHLVSKESGVEEVITVYGHKVNRQFAFYMLDKFNPTFCRIIEELTLRGMDKKSIEDATTAASSAIVAGVNSLMAIALKQSRQEPLNNQADPV